MGKVIILDENTANRIAAGEVIERPASVIKELVENSIDAGADRISIEIKNGGISYIKVTDNGSGIEADDVEIAFERHATSKIKKPDDLVSITTLGFRGEALASIAAVSNVQLKTKTKNSDHGMYIEISAGVVKDIWQAGCPAGTAITVKDLFFNTPARYKFLKKDSTEAGYITDLIERLALGNPGISFSLSSGAGTVFRTPGNRDLKSAIFSVYGKETADSLNEVMYNDEFITIKGFIGKPELSRSNRNHQSLFINNRYVKSRLVSNAVEEAYKTYMMKERFPFYVLNLELNPCLVDVNVHPNKMEIRFSNEHDIYRSVFNAINTTLTTRTVLRKPFYDHGDDISNSDARLKTPSPEFSQQALEYPAVKDIQQASVYEDISFQSERVKETELSYVNDNANPKHGSVYQANETDDDRIYPEAIIAGQLFDTYILLQQGESLIMIDQHAAHERIMYEKLLSAYKSRQVISQLLAIPEVVDLTTSEHAFVLDNTDFFQSIGFKYEDFGNNSIVLRGIPFEYKNVGPGQFFIETIDMAISREKKEPAAIADEILYTIACKAAVKANKRLYEEEIRVLLKELAAVANPFSCPHGRPTAIRITKRDIEKMFKRII